MKSINSLIVEKAYTFLGKEEIRGNLAFKIRKYTFTEFTGVRLITFIHPKQY